MINAGLEGALVSSRGKEGGMAAEPRIPKDWVKTESGSSPQPGLPQGLPHTSLTPEQVGDAGFWPPGRKRMRDLWCS